MTITIEALKQLEEAFSIIDSRFDGNILLKQELLISHGLSPESIKSLPSINIDDISNQNTPNKFTPAITENTMMYSDKWYVLQNRLVNAITDLDLNERRLLMLLSPLVRRDVEDFPDKRKRVFRITVLDFAKEFGLLPNNAYKTLEKTADSIITKAFFYWNFEGNIRLNKVGLSWFTKCEYKEKQGCIEVELPDEVVEMLSVFDKNNPFTKFEIDILVKLGSYGIILYELIVSNMYRNNKNKIFTVEFLREKFNCIETYPKISEFKRRVLDRAISDIHEHTTIRISYDQIKVGRNVKEFVFSFEDTSKDFVNKPISCQETASTNVFNMSEKQLKKFSNLLAREPELEKYAVGDLNHYGRLAEWIEEDLQKPERMGFYKPLLKRLGYAGVNQ